MSAKAVAARATKRNQAPASASGGKAITKDSSVSPKKASAKKMSKETNENASGEASPESLDKVRDILFGAQARETDKKFSRIEERLQKDTATLREEIRKRLDSLEEYVKSEVQTLIDRLKSEQSDRASADKDITKQLNETAKDLDKRLGATDERLTDTQRDLRKQLLEQSKSLRDEIADAQKQLNDSRERGDSELRSDKVDRSALADLLTELALRLKEEESK